MREIRVDKNNPPTTELEAAGFQQVADGINAIGFTHRKQLKRANWHRVVLFVRWTGRRQMDIAELVMREDKGYVPPE